MSVTAHAYAYADSPEMITTDNGNGNGRDISSGTATGTDSSNGFAVRLFDPSPRRASGVSATPGATSSNSQSRRSRYGQRNSSSSSPTLEPEFEKVNLTTVPKWLPSLVNAEIFARKEAQESQQYQGSTDSDSEPVNKQSTISGLISAGHEILFCGDWVNTSISAISLIDGAKGLKIFQRAKLHDMRKYKPSLQNFNTGIELRWALKIAKPVYDEVCCALGSLSMEKSSYLQYCIAAGLSLSTYQELEDREMIEEEISKWKSGLYDNSKAIEGSLASFLAENKAERERGQERGQKS